MLSGIDPYTFDNLPASTLTLQLLTPFPVPTHQSSQFVCETASRLLFISVHWARRTGYVFRNLLYPTQVALIKNCWSSLFLLCLAQCRELISLPAILTAIASTLQHGLGHSTWDLSRANDLATTLKKISIVLDRVDDFHLEPEEFAYLKLCCLFSPGTPQYIEPYFN